jgi:hypothetical protein
MDIERILESIEIEYDTDNNFDDLYIKSASESFYCQMKDYDSIELSDLVIDSDSIKIKGGQKFLAHDNKCNRSIYELPENDFL